VLIESTLRLRPYQVEAQRAVVRARESGRRRLLVSLATGLGKTVLLASLPELLELRATDVTLVVAHRDELIAQTAHTMREQNPGKLVGIEKADDRAPDGASIVVATVQTLAGKRLAEFVSRFGRRIALFVIDEAHHAAAPTYRAIVDAIVARRPDALILGLTATPFRGDGVKLTDVFPDVVYSVDARQAIDAGHLVPVRSYAINTQTDLDDVGTRGGDFVLGQLADAVDNAERNAAVLEAYERLTPGKKALVFTASVEHARNVAELFAAAGIRAAFASGETPRVERERIVDGFRGCEIDVLVNCGLYLEGFDVPSIEVIINARPTKSTTLYTQVTGRGLRPVDDIAYLLSALPSPEARRETIAQSVKPYAIVLDVVDRVRRHQIVTLPTLWGLPSQIDAQGLPISQVAERYEELYARSLRDAARVRTAEQIETALLDLDEAAKPRERRVATWQQITPDHWRLDRPPHKVARDRKGRLVPHFSRRFAEYVATAKRIAPREDAEAFALRVLHVDRRAIKEECWQVDITPQDDQFVAVLTPRKGRPCEIARAPTLVHALAAAEERLHSGEDLAAPKPPAKTAVAGRSSRRRPRPRRAPKAAAGT